MACNYLGSPLTAHAKGAEVSHQEGGASVPHKLGDCHCGIPSQHEESVRSQFQHQISYLASQPLGSGV